jgi:hypothetical protein
MSSLSVSWEGGTRERTGTEEGVEEAAGGAGASEEMPPDNKLRNLPTPKADDKALIKYGGRQGRLYGLPHTRWLGRYNTAAYAAVVVAII